MKKNDRLDVWEIIGTVGCWLCVISFLIMMIGATCYRAGLEVLVMDGFWDVVLNSVLPAAITGIATIIISFFVYLKKLPELIAKELDEKMDNLKDEQGEIKEKLKPDNGALHEDHEKLQTDQKSLLIGNAELKASVGTLVQRAIEQDCRYAALDADQRTVADAVAQLGGLVDRLQRLQERVVELETENRGLRRQLEIGRKHQRDIVYGVDDD